MHATIVSTYPPRACGLATFSRDQRAGMIAAGHAADIVSVVHQPAGDARAPEVVYEIRQHERADYASAAERIAASGTDIVVIQHEFGIFGGNEGLFVLDLMDAVPQPVVSILHTVLPRPEPHYHRATRLVAQRSDRLIVMTETARDLLRDVYSVDPARVDVIPHGAPAAAPTPRDAAKAALGLGGRTVLLTFGLLGPSKGIEFALNSLDAAVAAQPDVLYVVLGATHPEIVRREGEAYRERLVAAVEARGLADHVRFENRYVDNDDLWQWLCAADVYVSPYPGLDQICSGTLAFALAAGLPIVSTPYLHAREVLADGVGVLVEPGDTDALGQALAHLASDPDARAVHGARARAFGETTVWPRAGARYGDVFAATIAEARRAPRQPALDLHPGALPAALGYLAALTDDTGPFQHAACGVPDRRFGYCTDDAGRALVAAFAAARHLDVAAPERAAMLRLARTCLSFVAHAQRPDGAFENEMGFDRAWHPETATEDTVGRAMWGLGAAVAWSPEAPVRTLATALLDRALPVGLTHPRAVAYAAAGLDLALARFPGHPAWRDRLAEHAASLVSAVERCGTDAWRWVCDEMTYSNAIVPHALLAAARHLPHHADAERWRTVGRDVLDFVLEQTLADGVFDPVGNAGWLHRDGGARAAFDQQPIEAGYTAWVAAAAAHATGETRYADAARAAAAWFFGHNRLGVPVVDVHSGASYDGLTPQGVNLNQGAESAIALALALLADVPAPPVARHAAPRAEVRAEGRARTAADAPPARVP